MSRHDSTKVSDVKIMLKTGVDGIGIATIEKTSTNVLVDTYTITMDDGTKSTFTVTNGKGIESIEKTSTNVLVDTYTITFNDGTTGTFDVTNGRGISNIAKTGTQGLIDTYTITFNDGTTSTFTVTNGATDLSMIAPIQTSLVASQAYAIGDQFIYNGLLYKATADISSGGTITIGGNCELSDTVVKQIGKTYDVNLVTGYTLDENLTCVENGVAHLNFSVSHNINASVTQTGNHTIVLSGAPSPKLNSGKNALYFPCSVYMSENRELASSISIGTSGAIDAMITKQMMDSASEISPSGNIEIQYVINVAYPIAD